MHSRFKICKSAAASSSVLPTIRRRNPNLKSPLVSAIFGLHFLTLHVPDKLKAFVITATLNKYSFVPKYEFFNQNTLTGFLTHDHMLSGKGRERKVV